MSSPSFSFDDGSSSDQYDTGTDISDEYCYSPSRYGSNGFESAKIEPLCHFSEADLVDYFSHIKQEEFFNVDSNLHQESKHIIHEQAKKKRKQGTHGNQVRSDLFTSWPPFPIDRTVLQDPTKARTAQTKKWGSAGDQVPKYP
jgi:hypothetical protein